jgi:hypothetical protein
MHRPGWQSGENYRVIGKSGNRVIEKQREIADIAVIARHRRDRKANSLHRGDAKKSENG